MDSFQNIERIKTEACRAYARMMNNFDYPGFEPWLADDFHYASQWVFGEITSKAAYEEYIIPKLQTIASSGSRVWAELAFNHKYGRGPCVVVAQGERRELAGDASNYHAGRQGFSCGFVFCPGAARLRTHWRNSKMSATPNPAALLVALRFAPT